MGSRVGGGIADALGVLSITVRGRKMAKKVSKKRKVRKPAKKGKLSAKSVKKAVSSVRKKRVHKHNFRYAGGEAMCSCGKYLQPDGRVTCRP